MFTFNLLLEGSRVFSLLDQRRTARLPAGHDMPNPPVVRDEGTAPRRKEVSREKSPESTARPGCSRLRAQVRLKSSAAPPVGVKKILNLHLFNTV